MIQLIKQLNNLHLVILPSYDIWFSYETPIAVRVRGETYISNNEWSSTTGKHLNYISRDKSIRIPHSDILKIIEEEL